MLNRRAFLLGMGAAVPIAASGYSVAIEPRLSPRLVSYQVSPPGWQLDGVLRIGVIADIHACEPWMPAEKVEAIVARHLDDLLAFARIAVRRLDDA